VNRLEPSAWQRSAIQGLAHGLSGAHRAALLQLPTGFGKSLVAIRVYEELRRRKPGLGLVVVLPKQVIPSGWRAALGLRPDESRLFEWISAPHCAGKVRFETKRKLGRAMLNVRAGRPPRLASELHEGPHLVVVDEVHRHQPMLKMLSWIFLESANGAARDAERYLTTPFRSPEHGARSWPKWLLLSATPFNPVSLDRVDPLDDGRSDDTFEEQDGDDERAFADEVEKTLGALARLSGLRREPWFDEHIATARERLDGAASAETLLPPDELVVWPGSVRQRAFRPPRQRRWCTPTSQVQEPMVERALREVVLTAKAVGEVKDRGALRRATAERFVLSGGDLSVEGARIEGQPYALGLVRAVRAAVVAHQDAGTGRPAKLDALFRFLRDDASGEHVLVFCIHRAVAEAVARTARLALEERFADARVRTAIGEVREGHRNWFNRKLDGKTRVLVATDACSESIDLHTSANILVHYELPWSPLRVLQRVGRLWRIRPSEIVAGQQPATPRLPGVVHFAHPGSADEEILSRLRRRWDHLGALGLDYLSFDEALGTRLPAVDWPAGG
jgi:hypothetical protein